MGCRTTRAQFLLLAVIALGCDAGGGTDAADGAGAVFGPPDVVEAGADLEDTSTIVEDTSTIVEDTSTIVEDTRHADTSASAEDTRHEDTSTSAEDTRHEDSSDPADSAAPAEETWLEPTAAAPEIAYTPGGARTLLFLNNPEQLITSDLGDATLGDKTLFRVTASGACRSFFEHVNRAGRTIGFGIQVYNPGPATVSVTVGAAGWVASILGGAPFADAFNGMGAAAPVTLTAGKSTWILRRDEAVTHNTFFSGVVDFDVEGGGVIVNHIAYDSFGALDGSTNDLGYVQRVEPDGTHEARMYKGVASASEADAGTLEVTVGDAVGALPIRVARYDLGTGTYGAATEVRDWTTHIGPAQNASATTGDMVGFTYGAWTFDPLRASDGEGRYPNLGNWGVVYRLRVRVTNDGSATRTVTYRVSASPGAGAGIARSASGGAWTSHRLEKGVALDLGAVTVPAGATRELDVAWVLGGPSGGGLKNELWVD